MVLLLKLFDDNVIENAELFLLAFIIKWLEMDTTTKLDDMGAFRMVTITNH